MVREESMPNEASERKDKGKTRTQTLIQSTSQRVSVWSIRHQCWRVCSPTSNIKVGSPSRAHNGRRSSFKTVVRPSCFEPCSLLKYSFLLVGMANLLTYSLQNLSSSVTTGQSGSQEISAVVVLWFRIVSLLRNSIQKFKYFMALKASLKDDAWLASINNLMELRS